MSCPDHATDIIKVLQIIGSKKKNCLGNFIDLPNIVLRRNKLSIKTLHSACHKNEISFSWNLFSIQSSETIKIIILS